MTDTEKDIKWACILSRDNATDVIHMKEELEKQRQEIIKIRRALITIPISLLIGLLLGLLV